MICLTQNIILSWAAGLSLLVNQQAKRKGTGGSAYEASFCFYCQAAKSFPPWGEFKAEPFFPEMVGMWEGSRESYTVTADFQIGAVADCALVIPLPFIRDYS